MKWILGVYSNYESIKRGAGLLFKEKVAPRGSANIIISESVLEKEVLPGRGADFREITGDTESKAAAGKTPDVKVPLKEEQLAWIDHFLADKKSISFHDSGTVYIAGEMVLQYAEKSIPEGSGRISDVFIKAGFKESDASVISGMLKKGAAVLIVNTDEKQIAQAENLFRKGNADPVFIA